ncbi:MAG: GNAT family N-acetyltransferase [Dehalococcoidia bacterium]
MTEHERRSGYAFRPATDDDYDFLYGLHVAAMRPYVEQTWGWDAALQARLFREGFDPTTRCIIVVDGRDIGVLRVERRLSDVFLNSIEIEPSYQGRGLGTSIIGDILTSAHHEGLPVSLRVLHVNPARRLYERLGFHEVERTETHVIMRADPAVLP